MFIEKLDLFIHNLSNGEYYQFQELIYVNDDITTIDTQRYNDHLNNLKKVYKLETLKICDWMVNPFTANVNIKRSH